MAAQRQPAAAATKSFRLPLTLIHLLNSPRFKAHSNSIVRVLLSVYFNKRTFTPEQLETLIKIDAQKAAARNSVNMRKKEDKSNA